MNSIQSVSDLIEARSQPKAFIFLWVNWAIQARHSQSAVRRLIDSWKAACPTVPIPAYIADLSEQAGDQWDAVRDWLRAENRPVDELTYGGYGSLLWVVAGSIVTHCPFAAHLDDKELIAVTRTAFNVIEVVR